MHAAAIDPGTNNIVEYLERNQKKELLRLLTCGSVDDGKSTLIGRLLHDTKTIYEDQLDAVKRDSAKTGTTGGEIDLALLTDGLKAEREQGITIDVAYRYFSTDKRKFIIADTPGHEQYTRNMATGASTSQLAIILIDARHGMMPQTRRHSFIVSLLGLKHVVVAINKMDLVGYSQEVFERIRDEYTGFVAKLGIPDVQFIPMSALTGDNVVERAVAMPWYEGPPLLSHLETVHIASDRNLTDMRFPVQYVNRPNLDFRGFAGTVASGVIRKGDEVVALPSGKHSKVKSIVTWDGELEEAFAPQAITLTLEDEIDVSRGDMLVRPLNQPHVSTQIEAMVVWMAEKPFAPGRSYWFKHTTRVVSGELSLLRHGIDVNTLEHRAPAPLAMNEVGHAVLSLHLPIAYDAYKVNPATGSFIIIDRLTNNTVGAGMLLEPNDRPAADHSNREVTPDHHTLRHSQVTSAERVARFEQQPVTVLLTGLTASGKSTIASALERKLFDAGRAVTVLDDQNTRQGLSRDLGHSADDHSENLRRTSEVAKLMNDIGLICLCACVSPHEAARQQVKQTVGADRFVEVYLSAPVEVCRQRDWTGAYTRADIGNLRAFSGVSLTYEVPINADLVVPTHELSVEESVERIHALLVERRFIAKG